MSLASALSCGTSWSSTSSICPINFANQSKIRFSEVTSPASVPTTSETGASEATTSSIRPETEAGRNRGPPSPELAGRPCGLEELVAVAFFEYSMSGGACGGRDDGGGGVLARLLLKPWVKIPSIAFGNGTV